MTEVQSKVYIEAVKAIALVVLALAGFRWTLRWRPRHPMLIVALLPVLLRFAMLPINPVPEPRIHDEYGNLLLAETFSSGRITNPPHPYRASFEAVYILVEPTYTAQYQPALGAVLAGAMLVFGHPWAGVVLSMAALAAVLYWMLAGWVSRQWAFAGSAAAAVQIGVFDYWMNTYWGGTVPAIGGTLVLGALPRLRRARGRVPHAAMLAAGLAMVIYSRPLEAFLLGIVVAATVTWWTFRTRDLTAAAQVVLPAGLIVAAAVAGQGYYNFRVTGSAVQFPYMLHQERYGTPQPFWWQEPVTVSNFRHKSIEDDYLRQRRLWERRWSPPAMLKSDASRVLETFLFYLGVPLAIPLLFIRRAWRDPQVRFALLAGAPFLFDYLTFHAFYAHYAAPVCALLYLVVVQCWRRMGRTRLAHALPVVVALGVVLPAAGKVAEPVLPASWQAAWDDEFRPRPDRARMEDQLRAKGGEHLVFIRYHHPLHHPDNEWVRNAADIDRSRIVWARELDRESNFSLMRYYPNRKVWLLEPDVHPLKFQPYAEATDYVATAR
jgi:hypothetical protein